MSDWQKIREGMKLIKEGCHNTICSNSCPFFRYCQQGERTLTLYGPGDWRIPPKNKNYEVTLSYKVLVSDAPNEEKATRRALADFDTVRDPDKIEIKTIE